MFKNRSKKWTTLLSLLFLLLLGIGLASALDEQALVSHAYSIPMMAFRLFIYGVIFAKAVKKQYCLLAICAALNELFIYLTWSGALTLW